MPFGNVYLKEVGLYFFDGDAPDVGLPRAIETLGWTCQVERGGDEQTALQRLRAAIEHGPVLLGPLDMGYLTYNPNYRYNGGSDHYVTVLAVERDHILVHDPKGFPYATLPFEPLLQAWRAEKLGYLDEPGYTLRSAFRQVKTASRQEMIARTLPMIAANLEHGRDSERKVYGVPAVHRLIQALRGEVSRDIAGHLLYFALPVGVRHKLDAQAFLAEGNKPDAAELLGRQARLLGQAQYPGVQQEWSTITSLLEQFVALEEALIGLCASW